MFLSLMSVNLRRAFLSKGFLIGVLSTLLLLFFGASPELFKQNYADVWEFGSSDILSAQSIATHGTGGALFIMFGVLPILGFGTTFAEEWQQNAINFWVGRVGIVRYALGKALATAISGFLMPMCGFLLFLLLLLPFVPLHRSFQTGNPYEMVLLNQGPLSFFLIISLHYALGAMMCSMVGLGISTLFPDKFVAVSSPMIIYFFLLIVLPPPKIPEVIWPVYLVDGIFPMPTPLATILVRIVFVSTVCILTGISSLYLVRRRFENG